MTKNEKAKRQADGGMIDRGVGIVSPLRSL